MTKERKNQSMHVIFLAFLTVLLSSLACTSVRDFGPFRDPVIAEDEGNNYAGTYKGKITDNEIATEPVEGDWVKEGTVELNEILIIVADDGSVTGRLSFYRIGNIVFTDSEGCSKIHDHYFIGEATGQLIEDKGEIVFEIEQQMDSKWTENCRLQDPSDYLTMSEFSHTQNFEIEIIGNELVGTSIPTEENGHRIKATFRLNKTD